MSDRRPARQLLIVALVVALVVAIGVGIWQLRRPGEPAAGPSASPTPTSSVTVDWSKQPRASVQVTIDLDELKRGPDPRLPWYADGAIHDGSQVTPVRHGMGEWPYESVGFLAADGAYGVTVTHPEGGGFWGALIDRRGNVLDQVDVQAVSADGSLVAWLERKPGRRLVASAGSSSTPGPAAG